MEAKAIKKRNPHVNNIILKVIECLRCASRPLLLSEIEQIIKIPISAKEDLLDIIKDTRKICYDPVQERFSLNKLYPINDRFSLLDFLKSGPHGIPENQDLFDCYRGIEKDIATLKEQGLIRTIYNTDKDKKFNVLFYKNPDDTVEINSKPIDQFVKDLWKKLPKRDPVERLKIIDGCNKRRKL
ncbi:unnamed protein product [Blepharisma stoltei]|uniref:TFIIE beta domain-containing protein n=1 Tax=Blepharisma stoltei TaxID=1481888 RepID=A0AAU9K3T1_9CILI|nr:unnamed protein product [Blepharisma stoltei]